MISLLMRPITLNISRNHYFKYMKLIYGSLFMCGSYIREKSKIRNRFGCCMWFFLLISKLIFYWFKKKYTKFIWTISAVCGPYLLSLQNSCYYLTYSTGFMLLYLFCVLQAPPKKVPKTIESMRVYDETMVNPEDEEVWDLHLESKYISIYIVS